MHPIFVIWNSPPDSSLQSFLVNQNTITTMFLKSHRHARINSLVTSFDLHSLPKSESILGNSPKLKPMLPYHMEVYPLFFFFILISSLWWYVVYPISIISWVRNLIVSLSLSLSKHTIILISLSFSKSTQLYWLYAKPTCYNFLVFSNYLCRERDIHVMCQILYKNFQMISATGHLINHVYFPPMERCKQSAYLTLVLVSFKVESKWEPTNHDSPYKCSTVIRHLGMTLPIVAHIQYIHWAMATTMVES